MNRRAFMLLQFNVENFTSFKKEVILSLSANSDKEHKDSLFTFRNEKVLPSLAIYGPNASGKTNINKALTSAIMLVRNSNSFQIDTNINVTPFLLDETSKNEKTRFGFLFVYNDTKYEYSFTVDRHKVYEEYLYAYKTSQPSMIFERTNVNEYKYTEANKRKLKPIEAHNTANKLFLSTATAWNSELTKDAYMWFSQMIDTYDSEDLNDVFLPAFENDKNNEIKSFTNQLLKNADINISGFDLEIRDKKDKDILLPPGFFMEDKLKDLLMQNAKEWKLTTHHKVRLENEEKDFELPFHMESRGTQMLFSYAPIFQNALKYGKTVIIDEIDSGLHPVLVQYLIQLFNDPKINTKNAQLIFNTHDINLLDLDLFRRDQIYFVEKDNQTGISDLYSLDEFAPRKTDNIQKKYLQGRYGAIPCIGVDGIKW